MIFPQLRFGLVSVFVIALLNTGTGFSHDIGAAHSDIAIELLLNLPGSNRDAAQDARIEKAIAENLLQADTFASRVAAQNAPVWFDGTPPRIILTGGKRAIRSNRKPTANAASASSLRSSAVASVASAPLSLPSSLASPSFTPPSGNGALMAASFAPFKPKVRYYWDGTYFYEESDGIPDRTRMPNLMVGITSWQQQVPLATSYFASTTNSTSDTGSLGYLQPNYWRLPLVPVPSASPIPISSGNFQRGAIALAADGVPIFNPANNTGRISYEIGELDSYGGHCGLGDDYHYHIAPVHLIPVLGNDKPIAWSLDGYPMYGYVEPDGSAMLALDSDGGHTHGTWGYHYHARGTYNAGTAQWTPSAPYMNAAFHGAVVNYGGQVDPQPSGSGLRGSGTGGYTAQPVAGASIMAFKNPVALSIDGSGHFIENVGGTPSNDDWLMRISVSGVSYDICWRLNRTANPRTMTITWRLPGATTTTTYNNSGNRITTYPMAASSMTNLPDTSQTLDTTATFGEDADYTIHAQSFTDNSNGTVTDNVTGLMWQKVDNGESTWETAVSNAASVNTGGYNDWRLPTPGELFSILNHNNGNPAAIDTTYFPSNPNGTAGYWWSSDLYASSTTNVWCANAGGGLGPKPKTETISAGGSLRYHARYVRGAKPTNAHNYLNNGDGTITDLDTGLMWSQLPGPATTWDASLTYAENLSLGGYTDWRLPNIKELQTLSDYTLATATTTTGIKPSINRTMFAKTLTNCTTTTTGTTITCADTTGLIPGMVLVDAVNIANSYIPSATPPVIATVGSGSFTVTAGTGIVAGSGLTLKALVKPTAYWSSTTVKGSTTTEAWLVETGINSASNPQRNSQGIISYEVKTATYPVFAVRTTSVTTQIAVEQPSGTALTDGVSTVSYGNVNVGSTSTKTFTIRNNGATSLTITGVTIDGTSAANFSVAAQPATPIAANGSTTFDVQFNASTAGNKVAGLHIASSDTAVGAAFDITLSGTGYIPPPTITNVTTSPAVPSNTDTPTISAAITAASGATISTVQLTYSTGAQTTNTVFNETMATVATSGTGAWDQTASPATYAWTLTNLDGAGNIKQTAGTSNHTTTVTGSCGLVFGKGSASSTDPTRTMVTLSNPINATGTFTSGSTTTNYVEFWVRTVGLTGANGWSFQLAPNGSAGTPTWTQRVAEFTGSVHGYQLYHYDLLAGDLTSDLKMRFGFVGNGVGGPTGSSVNVDDITVVTTSGAPPQTLTMSTTGNGIYTAQLPAFTTGTTVSYSISATDSNGSTITLAAAGSYTTGIAPTITSGATLPNATPNVAYSTTLAATGGAGGNVWSIFSGALPSGLTLSSGGVISGTPTAQGTFNATIKVTDSAGRIGSKAFTLTVTTTTAPNVVIILTDDQGWADVGYHTAAGQVPIQTPNMDSFGTTGIRLEKFYPTTVCAVTRGCLLTGRNSLRTSVGNQKGLGLTEHLMPQTFKAAGYQTFMCGKWHIGGWDNNIYTTTMNGAAIEVQHEGPEYHPLSRGWDFHKGQYGGAINYFTHTTSDPGRNNAVDWWQNGVQLFNDNTDLQGNGGYSTDLLADKAVEQIVNRDKAKPMVLYVAFNAIHAGVSAPQSYLDKYAALGVSGNRRTICAAVDCMDVAMGRVLAALDSEGIANNTLVVFMSDNGGDTSTGSLNTPLRGTKSDSYDGGLHTPAAIRWPGHLTAGVTSNQYVWVGDIFPTVCAAVGVTPQNTKAFDGVNLWPALQSITPANPNGAARGTPLVTGDAGGPVALNLLTDPISSTTKMFKLIRTPGTTVVNQIFNLTDDPYETTDLLLGANAASYASIVTTLTSAITGIATENYPPNFGISGITQTVVAGSSITLYAPFTAYKVAPSVQWKKGASNITSSTPFYQVTNSTGGNVAGVYMATLPLSNVTAADAGSYTATATNTNGTATTPAGALIVVTAPVLNALPTYTAGTSRSITWLAVAGATGYTVQIAADSGFTSGVSSQTVATNTATFTGLTSGALYYYRATANYNATSTPYGNIVSSTQDASSPGIAISSPATASSTTHSTVIVTGTVSDFGSGVSSVAVNSVAATITGGTWTATVPLNAGSNTLTAIAADNAGNTASTFITITRSASTQNDGLPDSWKIANNIPLTSDPAYGPLGDIDRDGRLNLLEFAFNTNPQSSDADPIHVGTASGYLDVSFPRRIGALDLNYTVEVSDDLNSWNPSGTSFQTLSIVPDGNGITETVAVRVLPALNGATKKFVRVRVTVQ